MTNTPHTPSAAPDFDPEELGFDPEALRARYRAERDRRIRPDGNAQYQRVAGEFGYYADDPYVAEPEFTREPLTDRVEVVVVGGGFGGLLAGARLRQAGVRDIRVIEQGRGLRRDLVLEPVPGHPLRHRVLRLHAAARRDRLRPEVEVRAGRGDLGSTRGRIGRHFDLYGDACFQTQVTELRWDEDGVGVDRHHRPRRPHAGALRGDLQRHAQPGETARHPGHRELQGPHLPHQPLGLRLHRRRRQRRPAQARRQARGRHRHRRDRHPGACRTSARDAAAALRVPAHALLGRRTRQQRPTDPEWAEVAEARLAAAPPGQLPHDRHRAPSRTRTWWATAGPAAPELLAEADPDNEAYADLPTSDARPRVRDSPTSRR